MLFQLTNGAWRQVPKSANPDSLVKSARGVATIAGADTDSCHRLSLTSGPERGCTEICAGHASKSCPGLVCAGPVWSRSRRFAGQPLEIREQLRQLEGDTQIAELQASSVDMRGDPLAGVQSAPVLSVFTFGI